MINCALKEDKVIQFPFEVIDGGSGKNSKINKSSKQGCSTEVFAFKTLDEISSMLDEFNKKIENAPNDNRLMIARRNKLMFQIGINVGVRGGDLGSLKWKTFFGKQNGKYYMKDMYIICPEKTRNKGKYVKLFFNKTVLKAIEEYTSYYPIKSLDDYVFPSRKGDSGIKRECIWKIIKDTALAAGIKQNIGSHSLRKTFGYWCWHDAKDKQKALVILQILFNHSSTQSTMHYIGVMDQEVSSMFNSIEIGNDFFKKIT